MKRFLILLFVFSLLLRLGAFYFSKLELFGDEVDVGYLASSLYKTGRDLYRVPLPIYINSLSENRLPVLIYSTVPSIAALGLNEFSVRLPQIFFGALAPIILFMLVLKVSKNRGLSVFSAVFLSLTPWHIHYSRVAFEVIIMLDLIMLGALMYFRKSYFLSSLFFALSFYAYSTAIIFVPLLVFGLAIHAKKLPNIRFIIYALLFLSPFFFFLSTGAVGSRYQIISIFNNPELIRKNLELRTPNDFIFHNRYLATGEIFVKNYLQSFSTDFLFVRGDPTIRHSFMISGQLLPVLAPVILVGLGVLITQKQYFWLYWLAISPVSSSLTFDGGYHATRLFFMLVPLSLATAAGYWHLLRHRKFIWHILVFLLIIGNFVYLAHFYLVHYPKLSWRWWQVGYAEAFSNLPQNYSKIFINNTYEPSLIRFLFYTKYDPRLFQQQFTLDQSKKNIAHNYDGFTLGEKYIFGTFSENVSKYNLGSFVEPNALYFISARDEIPLGVDWTKDKPAGVKILSEINSPENTHLFYLVTKSP